MTAELFLHKKKRPAGKKTQPTINKRHPGSKSSRGYDGAGGVEIREWSLLAVTSFIEDGLIHSALTPTAPHTPLSKY